MGHKVKPKPSVAVFVDPIPGGNEFLEPPMGDPFPTANLSHARQCPPPQWTTRSGRYGDPEGRAKIDALIEMLEGAKT
jgi:hypothetical protein